MEILSGFHQYDLRKLAAETDTSTEYPLIPFSGMLQKPDGPGRYVTLSVPESLVKSIYKCIKEDDPDIEDGPDDAHISVITTDELEEIGGVDKIDDKDFKTYRYELMSIESCDPEGWDEMDKVWFVQVKSRELEQLRTKYDLTTLPNEDHEFHITVGVRKKKAKAAQLVQEKTMLKGVVEKKAAGIGQAIKLLGRAAKSVGTPAAGRAMRGAGGNVIKAFGGGGPATNNLMRGFMGSPRLQHAFTGGTVGAGLGGIHGAYQGYQEGGIPGILTGGLSGAATGAAAGGAIGALGGNRIGNYAARARKGVGAAFAPVAGTPAAAEAGGQMTMFA